MGYQPQTRHNKHKRGKSCPECIRLLEIECGIREQPKPPLSIRWMGFDERENVALINSIEQYLEETP